MKVYLVIPASATENNGFLKGIHHGRQKDVLVSFLEYTGRGRMKALETPLLLSHENLSSDTHSDAHGQIRAGGQAC